jgi:hypothetical protein
VRSTMLRSNLGSFADKNPPTGQRPMTITVGRGRSMPERVRAMFQAVTLSILDPQTTVWSSQAVGSCPARDDVCEINAIAGWLRERLIYRGEVPGFDRFQTLARSVELRSADCDCDSVAGIAMLSDKGYTSGVRIVMFNQSEGHAYNIVRTPRLAAAAGQRIVPLDLSESAPLGWEVNRNKVVSSQDYWYEPLPWIAWARSGAAIEAAPLPRPVPSPAYVQTV